MKLPALRMPWKAVKWTPLLCWRLGLAGVVLVCAGVLLYVWFSGASETHYALSEGRRLVLSPKSGILEGKKNETNAAPTPESETPGAAVPAAVEGEPAPVAIEEPAEPKEADAAAPAPEIAPQPAEEVVATVAVATADSAAPVLAEDLGEPADVKPSAAPLAEVKSTLLEKTAAGLVPIVSAASEKSWQYYAKPYERKDARPIIAIVITGLGQGKTVTNAAIKLPEAVTLSFNPYARDAAAWAEAARRGGHEVMVDLPLEASNYPASDPGPYGLVVAKGVQENGSRLQWLMARLQGFIGFMTLPGEAYTAHNESFEALAQTLAKRGLMLALAQEPAKDETLQLLTASTVPSVAADVIIDEELSAEAIQARFKVLEKRAVKAGSAIGMAQALPISIQQLGIWAAELDKRGIVLAPLSFMTTLKKKP